MRWSLPFFFVFFGSMGTSFLHAQKSNEQIALELVTKKVAATPDIGQIQSFFTLPGMNSLSLADSGKTSMSLSPPTITYLKRQDRQFDRKIELPATLSSGERAEREVLRYEDIISYRQMRRLIRNSNKLFRGEDPTFRAKWLFPTAAVIGGTGTTFALFYLRSQ